MGRLLTGLVFFVTCNFSQASDNLLNLTNPNKLIYNDTQPVVTPASIRAELEQIDKSSDLIDYQRDIEEQKLLIKEFEAHLEDAEELFKHEQISEIDLIQKRTRLEAARFELERKYASQNYTNEEIVMNKLLMSAYGSPNDADDLRIELIKALLRYYEARLQYYGAALNKSKAELVFHEQFAANGEILHKKGTVSDTELSNRHFKKNMHKVQIDSMKKQLENIEKARDAAQKTLDKLSS